MRIVAKIATAGVSGLSRFPFPNASIDECLTPDGRLDEIKVRKALDCEQVQVASTDDLRVLAFAMEYLKQMASVVKHLADNLNRDGEVAAAVSDVDTSANYRTAPATLGDRRCERNMNKGRFAFCRTDITGCADGIHAKLTIQNPRGVVGNAECFARDFAMMCARILLYLRENITTTRITLLEGEGASGIYAAAEDMNRRCDLAKLRASCAKCINGYCSPSTPDCPLYHNGKCKEP